MTWRTSRDDFGSFDQVLGQLAAKKQSHKISTSSIHFLIHFLDPLLGRSSFSVSDKPDKKSFTFGLSDYLLHCPGPGTLNA